MKRILITSSDAMMYQFLLKHALNLIEHGFEVDLASFPAEGYEGQNYFERIREILPEQFNFYKIDTARSPLSPSNSKGYKQLREIISNGNYDLIWTNEPVMGVLTRLASRKQRKSGTKVMYITHGFHFYKGAPLKNWLVFYPIEWVFSHITDTLVTVNRDDYALAQKKMKAKNIRYIHGIGFDTERFAQTKVDRNEKRREMGIPEDAFVVLSVGELNDNKNHTVVLDAIARLDRENVRYIICGEGDARAKLEEKIRTLGIEGKAQLLGFREDVSEICRIADVYCFPSIREGLGVATLEAMSCGLPAVCSDIRGPRDLIENGNGGYLCKYNEPDDFTAAFATLYDDRQLGKSFGARNVEFVDNYNADTAQAAVLSIIGDDIGIEKTATAEV